MKSAIAAGMLALVSAATCLVLAPAASAAPAACVTSTLTTGSNEGVGTQVRKSSTSSCGDLNLTYSDDKTQYGNDGYAGRLYHTSSSSWVTCTAGYVWAFDGSHSVNDSKYWLCTDVSDNTLFTVASAANGGDTVRITH
ncbi:hypothetical protein ACFV0T_26935 [Streptomyces sp. NPDC059582]|uniref:hypothetical protein n=1 Tax=Streptomyces sp. NPDC059582 TaxID=3346875 RepID=UPI0036A67A7F